MPDSLPAHGDILSNLLLMLQRELTETLRPELQSSYALHVTDVLTETLGFMQDWVSGRQYPDISEARRQLAGKFPPPGLSGNRLIPEFDDAEGADSTLAAITAELSGNGDTANLTFISPEIARIYENLYRNETEAHNSVREKTDRFLAGIDLDLTRERADSYLSAKLGIDNDPVARVQKIPGGYSKDTFLLALQSGEGLIVRRDFPFGPVDTSAPDEFDLLHGLYQKGFPVAKPVIAEYDKQYFGQPFLMVEKIPGIDADVAAKANPQTARYVSLELARLLGELHSTNPAELGFSEIKADPREQVREYLQEWRDWWDLHRIHPSSLGEAAFAWLERNIPLSIERAVVVHGDARPGNMLFHEGKVTALLDWEFAHPGDAAEDLLYAKGFVAPYLSWEEFLEAYLKAGGAPISESSEQFYEIFRSLRNVICTDVAWSGFVKGKYPVFKLAVQGVLYRRQISNELAKSLQTVTW